MSNTKIQDPVFRRFYSHLNSAVTILQLYDGRIPFAHFVKNYFSQHKKFGSKDRRQISELCYCYFRLGRSYPQLATGQKIVKGYWLSKASWPDEWLAFFDSFHLPKESPDHIFPAVHSFSAGINNDAFTRSHLIQPDLFLRVRPGHKGAVTDKLKTADIPFVLTDDSLRLSNSVRVEDLVRLNQEVVVQDLSSQRVAKLLQLYQTVNKNEMVPLVWDCCAASGGKSILANDILQQMELTVSDIRPTILFNLKKRFQEARVKNYRAFVGDATSANPGRLFDLIIADVPCSGSGTWARTPEQLLYFEPGSIDAFVKLQSSITANIIQYLKPGGYLLYITCSVFEKENEGQVNLLQNKGLQLVEQLVLKGYKQKADTMFAALMKAPM
ncbi:methyltransferase domain-containing protein [Niabella yanshanensis]|uniref:Methyltransferase domain-containing protein n=1 Tax=Niabella yanshanensis TaxID=577386 RepID=A0ABZ0W9W7_9BACT|nr:methyltransferase domain-containing protein [Niabella yanshanensis]WQD40072.1 methyltransferase domain-containing protein [Niabella yanshanensis]